MPETGIRRSPPTRTRRGAREPRSIARTSAASASSSSTRPACTPVVIVNAVFVYTARSAWSKQPIAAGVASSSPRSAAGANPPAALPLGPLAADIGLDARRVRRADRVPPSKFRGHTPSTSVSAGRIAVKTA